MNPDDESRVRSIVTERMWRYAAENRLAKQFELPIVRAICLIHEAEQEGVIVGDQGMVEPSAPLVKPGRR